MELIRYNMKHILLGLTLLLFALFLSACSSTEVDETADWSPNKLYSEAQAAVDARDYEKAVLYFNKLEGRAAGTSLAQQAQLEAAYALFKNEQKAEAIAALDRFMQLHPRSAAIDYALYLKGVINFNDDLGYLGRLSSQDLSERDQEAAKAAFQTFNELVTRFPNSKYTPDARARMVYIVNSLAQSEVNIARYYYSRGAYIAAINRAQAAIDNYRQAPALEEALYILYKSYEAIGMNDLSAQAREIMDYNFPESQLHKKGVLKKSSWWTLW